MRSDPRRLFWVLSSVGALVAAALGACAGSGRGSETDALLETQVAGAATGAGDGFGTIVPTASAEERNAAAPGQVAYEYRWEPGRGIIDPRDGLGPTYTTVSCRGCHEENGRARGPTTEGEPHPGLLVRLRVLDEDGAVRIDDRYGPQLQPRSVAGAKAEGSLVVEWEPAPGEYGDGTRYVLRRPVYSLVEPAFGEFAPGTVVSARLAPAVGGAGLLEAVPDETLLAAHDPDDHDGDGISGRVHTVEGHDGREALGRLGWKAEQPTVADQVASALWLDLGITSSRHPDQNCPVAQVGCAAAQHGGTPEIDDELFDGLVTYVSLLAVPPAASPDDDVAAGAAHFGTIGCASCHTPTLRTGDDASRALAGHTIHPYTDLLLHDLGPGLADPVPVANADGAEWRTAPLWGLHVSEARDGDVGYLHDGRARDLAEAILWHGGEAAPSADAFRALPADERAELLAYLRSR